MFKKLLLILCVGYLPISFQGCDCGTDVYQSIGCDVLVLDNTGSTPVIDFDSAVSKKALGFMFQTVDTFVRFGYDMNFDLGYSCYAFSCESAIEFTNKISRVRVTSLNNYSDQYGPGSVITSLFSKDHLAEDSEGFLRISELSDRNQIFLFDTMAAPTLHRFRFDIVFSDGLEVSKISPALNLF